MKERDSLFAITDVRLKTVTGPEIPRGVVLVEGGKIVAVAEHLAVPSEAQVIPGHGRLLTPGLIEAHCHLGIGEEGIGFEGEDYNETTDPVTPHLRVIDGINPEEMGMRDAAQNGVTTVCIAPGSANVLGGQVAVVKTYGRIVDRMVLRFPAGIKAAFGENPKRVYHAQKKMPTTRMTTAALLREALVKAANYRRRLEEGGEDPAKLPERDLRSEALLPLLRREIPLRAHAHRADDILTAVRIAEEFDLKLVIEHCTEGHKIAALLAEKGIPAVVGPVLSARVKYELREKTFATAGVLVAAGVRVAITTDAPVVPIEHLPLCAGLAVRAGLPEEEAWRAMTINPATILGVADRVGSIEPGKDADLVLWDGDPFDSRTAPEMVWIDGELVKDRHDHRGAQGQPFFD
ncbi:MAG: amidohydrolase [Firmicutes bacterium]|nr:amidohydrolase [Bacillota bacterium]